MALPNSIPRSYLWWIPAWVAIILYPWTALLKRFFPRISTNNSHQDCPSSNTEKTPAITALARPPEFNYEKFVQLMLPSDKKLRLIFENDHETRTKFMDLQAEEQLLDMYKLWAFHMKWEAKSDPSKHVFYKHLFNELCIDFVTVRCEYFDVVETVSPLALWELDWIDNDGTTADISAYMAQGFDPFSSYFVGAEEAKEKYKYLADERPDGELIRWPFSQVDIKKSRRDELVNACSGLLGGTDNTQTLVPETNSRQGILDIWGERE